MHAIAPAGNHDWMIWWIASLTSGDWDLVTSFMATLRPMSMPKEMRASAMTSPTKVPDVAEISSSAVEQI